MRPNWSYKEVNNLYYIMLTCPWNEHLSKPHFKGILEFAIAYILFRISAQIDKLCILVNIIFWNEAFKRPLEISALHIEPITISLQIIKLLKNIHRALKLNYIA